MIVDKNIKIDLLASTDPMRVKMMDILYEDGYLIATDGHVIAQYKPQEEDFDKHYIRGRYIINSGVFRFIRNNFKSRKKDEQEVSIRIILKDMLITQKATNKAYKLFDVVSKDEDTNPTYPDWKSVIPDESIITEIAFNPKLLNRTARALNLDILRIQIRGECKAITIKTLDPQLGHVMIMPMRWNNE